MSQTTQPAFPGIHTLRFDRKRLNAKSLRPLWSDMADLGAQNTGAVLVDLSSVLRISACGIAALLEFYSDHKGQYDIAFSGLRPTPQKKLDSFGLTRVLPMYGDRDQALATSTFRQHKLSGTRAVVLCAGKGTRMAPLSWDTPKPMLDMLGKPVLERILDHLSSFGLRDIALNPGYHGDQIIQHFQARKDRNILFSNEGFQGADGWEGTPLGSASTLSRLHHENNFARDDIFVLCGDALIDVDLADMMQRHKQSGALVTIAAQTVGSDEVQKYGVIEANDSGRALGFQEKPAPHLARSNLASTGIYVFSPAAIASIERGNGLDIARDFLPSILHSARGIHVYEAPFQWKDLGCGKDYAATLALALRGKVANLRPQGREILPGVWAHDSARIAGSVRFDGPAYISAHAVVQAHSRIIGPSVIGAHSWIGRGAQLDTVILAQGSGVMPGSSVTGQIASPYWSIATASADGATLPRDPLPQVAQAETLMPQQLGLATRAAQAMQSAGLVTAARQWHIRSRAG